MQPSSWLLYGPPGAGKTTLAVSAFWDIHKLKMIRRGLWLQIGQERNRALGVPEKYTQRFASDPASPLQFVAELQNYLRELKSNAAMGRGPEVLVVDGLTELGYILTYGYAQAPSDTDKWAAWRYQKDILQSVFQLADPIALNCHVIATCRVGEFKRGVVNKQTGEVSGRDPSYFDTKHFPQMDGWGRLNTPSYFEYVFYIEQETSHKQSIHRCHLIETGEFKVKNAYAHRWGELEQYLDNPTFDDVLGLIDRAAAPAEEAARPQQKKGETQMTHSKEAHGN